MTSPRGAELIAQDRSRLLGSVSLALFGQGAAFAFGLLCMVLTVRLLGPENYGRLAMFFLILAVLSQLLVSWPNMGLVRFGREELAERGAAAASFWARAVIFLATLLLAAGLLGLIFDTAFVAGGVFTPLQHLFPRPISPPWMICLWLNFAATLNVSMAWLRGRYLLAALFGAIGGPLAYYSGAKLGAIGALPTTTGMLLLAIGWGIMTPLLVWLARALSVGKKTPE